MGRGRGSEATLSPRLKGEMVLLNGMCVCMYVDL